ncbi:MAG: glycerol-3-phosphate dehydrogenase/oxidase [Leptonema illini]|jgi:glycerol-3-phosphate dehydrogenase|uniref:Glycerol-3-phosphate dehydrogenase/oxidase n=1 Tax=Leptonema illini TaxID=183 RepID=A0A833LZX2_9LEPT|nr:MAG: glycerol-3-phosphate dehydrogenase/oxidase [Leptonema illini]PKL31087.1 MAG: hypothetical protein CVV45_15625 [Spirochaetae bacterium HGW-Spirochaetae-10]
MLQIGKELSSGRYDVLIVGGGITGIAIAREAAERGLSVCLVEKNDFGGATSASTSKLIHGGLRYLENFEIGLVRESLAERRILGLAASHLVKPLPFMIPVLPWSKPGKLILRTGLYMYDALSYDRNRDVPEGHQIPGSVSLSEREVQAVDPMIASIAKGALLYYDYQSLHPERLTLAFLKSALQKGAVFYNHTEATGFIVEEAGGRRNLQGAEVRDTITGKTATIRAGITINASGPWMDLVLGLADRKSETKLSRSTGIHFLTKPLFKHNNAVLFRTRSGRHFFVVPWEGFSLIGPTDRPYTKHPDELRPGQDDFDQLFEDINDTLPGAPLTRDMIVDIPIGIRPLIFSGKSTYKASRRYEILDHESKGLHGLISVAGGKWTTSRQLGEDVMTLALSKLPDPGNVMNVNTGELPLFGSPGFGNPDDIYIDFSLKNFSTEGISPEVHRHLISMYGTEHTRILEYVHKKKALAKPVSDRFPTKDIMAQVLFSVEHEGARTVSDIIRRRIALGTYGLPTEKELLAVAQLAAPLLKWNQTEVRRQVKEALAEYPTELMGGKAPAGSRTTAKKSARTAAKKAVKKSVKKTAKKAAKKTGKKTSKKAARR